MVLAYERLISSTFFGIGSSFFSSGTVFLKIPASGLTLDHIPASLKVVFPHLFAWPSLCLYYVEVGQLL
jgi:hypothetical protein